MAQLPDSYPAEDINAVLEQLDQDSKDLVLAGLAQRAAERAASRETELWGQNIVGLAKAYIRTHSPDVDDSNIEGWFEDLEATAETVLRTLPPAHEKYQVLQDKAVKLAGVVYIDSKIQSGYTEDIDFDFLRNSQADPEWLLTTFSHSFRQAVDGDPEETETITELDQLGEEKTLVWNVETWEQTTKLLIDDLVTELTEQGYALPGLGEDGKYEEERY